MASEGLSFVVQASDRRRSLEAIRDKLAADLEGTFGKDAAPLARELRAVLAELDELPTGAEVSTVDEIAARRAGRAGAAPSGRTAVNE